MMTEWLVRKFVINPDDIQNEKTRFSYGVLTSTAGIICNILLFLMKLTAGMLMQSISVLSDSFNNLSDCFSGLIALFGYKAAAKPADEKHPFGHGRMEYIVSLAIAAMIFIAAFELFNASLDRILHPVQVRFDAVLFTAVVLTIPVKLWLSHMNRKIGERIASMPMMAVAEDARNDVFATLISLAGMVMGAFYSGFPFDGAAGVILSCMIFKSGWQMADDIITKLLGSSTDPELVKQIRGIILEDQRIRGVHDIIIHEYGPGRMMGSAHAEIDGSMKFLEVHDAVDLAEKKIRNAMHIEMTIHADPYSEEITDEQKKITDYLKDMDESLSIHDFHRYIREGKTVLDFDVMIPFGCSVNEETLTDGIRDLFDQTYSLEVRFDHGFTEEQES